MRETGASGRAARRRSTVVPGGERFRFLAVTPLEQPDLTLANALWRLGIAATVDLGRDPARWPAVLEALAAGSQTGLGVRIPDGVAAGTSPLPTQVGFLVVAGDGSDRPRGWRRCPWLAEVRSEAEAVRALDAGAAGLISKGQECGGAVGDESSFVLLQRLLALVDRRGAAVPVWCQGGIGLHTAAGAIAGGAFGVVLDTVLAVYPESALPAGSKDAVRAIDGSLQIAGSASGRPIAQDAALASALLAECPNLESLVRTLRQRVAGQLHQAKALRVIDEGNPWARAHGVRYPVAQGPMTRVSDNAAFAAGVAAAGGLPFLALAVLPEGAARELLQATREQLGDRPWGVGVLAFAPAEILQAHLGLVKEFMPSALLFAGGRPAQARPFVDLGIATYLHVPSPALLDDFLADGATHFVFEGRECGGHVGPRYSFVLWEQMLTRLARCEAPEALHILFAGGIHDDRSAAMVAAIAAPLAARGAKIGMLMGTAYIATREAVSSGALLEDFQCKVLAGDGTVLVETGPGHAIRCLPSGFVDVFEREKTRLRDAGVEPRAATAALEALTVGRLRVATKGVRHADGGTVPMAADRRDAEGMYMIGQAAGLTTALTTVPALHARVTRGATRRLAALEVPLPARAAGAEPVALIGMACVFPGAAELEAYWANILEGRDAVREVPRERWSTERYFRAEGGPDRTPSKWGGFIDELAFDPLAYGIPPHSLAAIEPAQLLALEVAQRALADAGYASRWFDRQKTAVIFGAESGMELASQYTFRNLYAQHCGALPEALAQALPGLTEDSFPGTLANVISGRIANRLGLGGVNYAVDAACASALAAVELGVKELCSGSSDLVIAGGVDCHNGINDYLLFAAVGALSPTGRCRSFDADADGICLGEGVGVVVLKRLADAERDGDRVYAVLDAVAGASDGKALGLTAPNRDGQKRALERTYGRAGILPAEVGLVEAHGTGTVVGDRTELATLTEVFNAGGALPGQAALGSVKSQIGHTKCAAGIAGLIKVAKALHHRVLPPTQQIARPNLAYRAASSPFSLHRRATPWLRGSHPRRAAVSAFGFGGTNFHALLSEHPSHASASGAIAFPAELFALRGESAADALSTLREIGAFVAASDAPVALRDLACSAWAAGRGPVQIAFAAGDLGTLTQRIEAALAGGPGADVHRRQHDAPEGKLACLFPGQGSQYPGMLRDLFVYFPALQRLLEGHPDLAAVMLPPATYDEAARRAQRERLTDTRCAQPALGLAGLAAFEWLHALGLRPDMAGGHSYGELVALATAGAFDAEALTALSRARAESILAELGEDRGAMAAVALDADALRLALADCPDVAIVNLNGPGQTVIAGPTPAIAAACALLEAQGAGVARLQADCAFHSPLLRDAADRFAVALAGQPIGALRWPVYANRSARPHGSGADDLRRCLAQHVASPVRFGEQIERMYSDGARLFVEVGPRQALTGLTRRILQGREHRALALDGGAQGLAGLLDAVAALAVAMPAFDAAPLFAGRAERIDLATPRRRPASSWLVDGGRARPLAGSLPPTPTAAALLPLPSPSPQLPASDQALLGYLGNLRQMVQAQRDVMVGYFGGTAPPAATLPQPAAEPLARRLEAAPTADAPADAAALLLDVVSRSTGYPSTYLDPDLDLEADLSIDSIKRLEIIGQLVARLGIEPGSREKDRVVEGLSRLATLRAMAGWLEQRNADALDRHVLRERDAPLPAGDATLLAGRKFIVADDGLGAATLLAARLRILGAVATVFDEATLPDDVADCDSWVHLSALNPACGVDAAKRLFAALRAVPAGQLRCLLVAGGAGLGGFVRSLARERPGLHAVCVDLDAAETPEELALAIERELSVGSGVHDVAWRAARRTTRVPVASPLAAGAGSLPLDEDSVVLITGGARGITARVTLALAKRCRCRIEIIGRTPLPGDEEAATTRGIDEPHRLRQALLAEDPSRRPAAVERLLRDLLAQREGRATLAQAQAAGASTRYHRVDVRDSVAFAACIADVYARHGRLDGVIHGAGVIEDKRSADKSAASFDRVFDTKVIPALLLRRELRDGLRFVVLFSSIASVFGNAGQADYAAANGVLDDLARRWQTETDGRVLVVNWGPWAGTGMVSDALARDFARRGVGLIAPAEGVEALLRELAAPSGDTQVLLTRGAPAAFAD